MCVCIYKTIYTNEKIMFSVKNEYVTEKLVKLNQFYPSQW